MLILPQGPIFELKMEGTVVQDISKNINLLCDTTAIDFGGVAIGKTWWVFLMKANILIPGNKCQKTNILIPGSKYQMTNIVIS